MADGKACCVDTGTGGQESLEMLRSPERWPRRTVLPLVRNDDAGCVVCDSVGQVLPIVFEVNLFCLKAGALWPQLKDRNMHTYATLEAMVADGWRVD